MARLFSKSETEAKIRVIWVFLNRLIFKYSDGSCDDMSALQAPAWRASYTSVCHVQHVLRTIFLTDKRNFDMQTARKIESL